MYTEADELSYYYQPRTIDAYNIIYHSNTSHLLIANRKPGIQEYVDVCDPIYLFIW